MVEESKAQDGWVWSGFGMQASVSAKSR
jgi:hypothetical protein